MIDSGVKFTDDTFDCMKDIETSEGTRHLSGQIE